VVRGKSDKFVFLCEVKIKNVSLEKRKSVNSQNYNKNQLNKTQQHQQSVPRYNINQPYNSFNVSDHRASLPPKKM
jgi:hypothetical protein